MSNDSITDRHNAGPDRGQTTDRSSEGSDARLRERAAAQAEFKRPERSGPRRFDDLF